MVSNKPLIVKYLKHQSLLSASLNIVKREQSIRYWFIFIVYRGVSHIYHLSCLAENNVLDVQDSICCNSVLHVFVKTSETNNSLFLYISLSAISMYVRGTVQNMTWCGYNVYLHLSCTCNYPLHWFKSHCKISTIEWKKKEMRIKRQCKFMRCVCWLNDVLIQVNIMEDMAYMADMADMPLDSGTNSTKKNYSVIYCKVNDTMKL